MGRTGGEALIPASGDCFISSVTAHELGHSFGLQHDFRSNSYIMSYGPRNVYGLSQCAAKWLDVHNAFNPSRDAPGYTYQSVSIASLPPSRASSSNVIHVRFKVGDRDGIQQVQLLTPTGDSYSLLACKGLNGNSSDIVEFAIPHLGLENKSVSLQWINTYGDRYLSDNYPIIDDTSLLRSAEVVSIPDANLAAAVREELDVAPDESLTTHVMLYLRHFVARNSGITDLTGLEHASNLTSLVLSNNPITDVGPLAELTQLTTLDLDRSPITDVGPLAELTQLKRLNLGRNSITDVGPLAELTQLTSLFIWSNPITDVGPLAKLTQLKTLDLSFNAIADVSPLVGLNLTGEVVDWGLKILDNPLSYTSINTHIAAMQAKGIEVWFDNVAHPALLKISGDAQEGAAGTTLTTPFVVEAMDEGGKPMQGVSITFAVTAGDGRLSATTATTDARGRARTTLTLGQRSRRNTVRATTEGIRSFAIFNATATGELTPLVADVNGDGAVNIQDLVLVASRLGQAGQNKADVNGDGAVNIQDLVLVAGELGTDAAAPSAWHHTAMGIPTRATVEQWLTQAHGLSLTDARSQRGILLLERLLATLAPEETALLTNYPNPFNPETWIPYHLSEPVDVTLTIYSVDGKVVRRLDLGHQASGYYQSKARAAYWDGRNAVGERVASGIYFYTLTVGDFSATKKLLIRK